MTIENVPHWAVSYHTNSSNPRSQKWYRVSRVIKVDGRWFELYWHPDHTLRGNNRAVVRELALAAGIGLLHGTFTQEPGHGMAWSLDKPRDPGDPSPALVRMAQAQWKREREERGE